MRTPRSYKVLAMLLAYVFVVAIAEGGSKKPLRDMRRYSSSKRLFDTTTHFNANNIDMAMRNSGQLIDATGGPGCEWPKGTLHHVLYTGGLWIAGKVNGSLRIAAVQYDTSCFQPGIMRFGAPSNPADTSFRFYTVGRFDTTGVRDFDNWPDTQGAPRYNGEPLRKGDQNMWCVYNDGRTLGREFRTAPLHVEVQQYVYGDSLAGSPPDDPANNLVFAEFKIANRDTATIDSVYLSLWLDPDIGESTDDVAGVDTALSLAYCYNGKAVDAEYGSSPPAVGLLVLRTPDGIVPPASSHAFIAYNPSLPGPYAFPGDVQEAYNYLLGLKQQGGPIIDPTTSSATRFMYSGDPVAQLGWVDTTAEEKAIIFSFGPYTLAAGDSTMFHTALVIAQGTDRVNSVELLKQAVPEVIQRYTSKLVDVKTKPGLPTQFVLTQNYPNPFNPSTIISYELPKMSRVTLKVFNILGQQVADLVNEEQAAGVHSSRFNAGTLSSGVYFYRLQAWRFISVKKMMLLK